MDIAPGTADAPIMKRGLAAIAKLFACRCRPSFSDLPHPAKPNINPPERSGDQHLGPNQLRWLEEKHPYFRVHRQQAEAPTGVAVVHPPLAGQEE